MMQVVVVAQVAQVQMAAGEVIVAAPAAQELLRLLLDGQFLPGMQAVPVRRVAVHMGLEVVEVQVGSA
jgi:hypothetical protein